MERKRIYALIPAYQPDNTLAGLVRDLSNHGLRVIVVDDGSGSDYKPMFDVCAENALVLRHESNRGKGAALKTGLTWLRNNVPGPYTVVTLDADGQHTVSDALSVANAAEEEQGALVLGSRRQGEGCPLRSRFGNCVTRLVYRAAARTNRAFSNRLVPVLLTVPGDRYEYEMNVLLHLAEEEVSILEVPIETIYLDGNKSSHFDTIRDSWRIYKDILKFSASSLLGFTVDYLLFSILTFFGFILGRHDGHTHFNTAELAVLHRDGLHVGLIAFAVGEDNVIQIGVFKINKRQIAPDKHNALKICPFEIGLLQIHIDKIVTL